MRGIGTRYEDLSMQTISSTMSVYHKANDHFSLRGPTPAVNCKQGVKSTIMTVLHLALGEALLNGISRHPIGKTLTHEKPNELFKGTCLGDALLCQQ